MILSVIIPVYNEEDSILKVIKTVNSVDLPKNIKSEIIIVNDCSTDNTKKLLDTLVSGKYKIIHHKKNQGKGAALRSGFKKATGDFVVVQDADLEYNPKDFKKLLKPLITNKADVVYGSRFLNMKYKGQIPNIIANYMLTRLSNLLSGLRITDMETCYKMIKRDIINDINLEENRFGFEPEITAKLAKKGCRIKEVPISYNPRKLSDGKKIGWKDGISAIHCILKYNLMR